MREFCLLDCHKVTMIDLGALQVQLIKNGQPEWANTLRTLPEPLQNRLNNRRVDEWQEHLRTLYTFVAERSILDRDTVTFQTGSQLNNTDELLRLMCVTAAYSMLVAVVATIVCACLVPARKV